VKRERETVGLDLFRLYLDQIGRHPQLTQDDEIRLAQAYQAGLHARRTLATVDPDDPARPSRSQVTSPPTPLPPASGTGLVPTMASSRPTRS
jgi:Sigma-70 factor, region 1.2